MGRVLLSVVLWVWVSSLAETRGDENQDQAIKQLAEFYRKHDREDLATKLSEGYRDKKIVFGETAGNDNAHYDHWSGITTLNQRMLDTLGESATGDAYKARAGAALTIAHEFEHSRQSYLGWHYSVALQRLKKGNPSEQDAWGEQFSLTAQWIRAKKRELDRLKSERRSAREIGQIASELKALTDTWGTYANDYRSLRSSIGQVRIPDPTDTTTDGLPADPLTLDELTQRVEELGKLAEGEMRIAGILAIPFDGTYRGEFKGDQIDGRIAFTIVGTEVRGRISGTTTTGAISGDVVGTINRDGVFDLEFQEGSIATKFGPVGFVGRIEGALVKGKVTNGRWATYPPGEGDEPKLWLDRGTWFVNKQ